MSKIFCFTFNKIVSIFVVHFDLFHYNVWGHSPITTKGVHNIMFTLLIITLFTIGIFLRNFDLASLVYSVHLENL